MLINTLLKKAKLNKVKNNHPVLGITSSSKEVCNNYIFIAVKGSNTDGYNYIAEAINNGAKTIISYKEYNNFNNVIVSNDTKGILALLLFYYYRYYLKRLYFIGITGTVGKTSTSTIIYEYLEYQNKKSLVIGSNGAISKNRCIKYNNTTPRIEDIYKNIIYACNNKIKYFIIEASSAASSEKRVEYIPFKIMIFTNFSLDHLDYHLTMDNYLLAKKHYFDSLVNKAYALINIDDNNYKKIISDTKAKIIYYGLNDINSNIYEINDNGYLSFLYNNIRYNTNLIGYFNMYNLLPLFYLNDILKLKNKIRDFLLSFKAIKGRMNVFYINNKRVIIDYAHTPEAVKESIKASLRLNPTRLYVIIGCGGSRDKSKRKIIGNILDEYNIIRIITSDNPRNERPEDIINDIVEGIKNEYLTITDRKKAISYAINLANNKDIVLILGKGAEAYIEQNGKRIRYSDIEYINSLNKR